MRIAAIQHDIVWENPSANYQNIAPMISKASDSGANLVLLSEMYSTGFSMASEKIAEKQEGESVSFLAEQAKLHDIWIAASIPIKDNENELPVNRLIVRGPKNESHEYDKLFPFTFAGEHENYRAGNQPVTIEILGIRTSLFICYDLRFADVFWELAPDTDLYLVVANWPSTRSEHWKSLLRSRAIENQAYVVGVNRVGEGDGLSYQGDSAIIDPLGEVLQEASSGGEEILIADIEVEKVSEVRDAFPFMNDRRK
ncbi:MAG: carbon-nitrogen family hydrolase [Actinomycetota bacterium]|jgi:predicted amidohydrolase|nr:carbon-nitrogen family hydrolase [Acidimicrobiales bacterium]MEC7899071.1 carbon-nitrogen family hydrolase [Actinomycetota bacterium]|tara:strand:- start:1035 stop:1799 length:765 start_codon:yes stop_codon:yes gene_type:complete